MYLFTQNSTQAIQRKLWDRIIEFNQTDHSVLSADVTEQVDKVLHESYYAFIGDKTYMEIAKAKHCELAFVATGDVPSLQFAFGLPQNSPYVKKFSEL